MLLGESSSQDNKSAKEFLLSISEEGKKSLKEMMKKTDIWQEFTLISPKILELIKIRKFGK